jgi:hypothetical protein
MNAPRGQSARGDARVGEIRRARTASATQSRSAAEAPLPLVSVLGGAALKISWRRAGGRRAR